MFRCGDITYLRTGEGWLFLATVIDLLLASCDRLVGHRCACVPNSLLTR